MFMSRIFDAKMPTDIQKQFSGTINAEASVIKQSLDQAQKSLTVNVQMALMIQELHEVNPDLRFYIMSNISRVSSTNYKRQSNEINPQAGTLRDCAEFRSSLVIV